MTLPVWLSDTSNQQNLFQPLLFDTFKNVKEIGVDTEEKDAIDPRSYPFSLLSLLSMIHSTSIKKITIYGNKEIWSALFSSPSFNSIKNKYREHQFEMKIGGYSTIKDCRRQLILVRE